MNKRWTAEEEAYLKANWGYGAAKRLARRFGRTPASVSNKAMQLGCATYRRGKPDEDLLAFIREQNAAGRLDTDITVAWNELHPERPVGRRSLCYLRKDILGLQVDPEARRRKRQEGYRTQCQVLRVNSVADLSNRHYRRIARRAGWPEDLRPLEVRILDVMHDGEFRSRREIAEAIGHDHKNQRWWFKCRYGSHSALANLVQRGLLKRTGKQVRKGQGKGHSAYEYWMPLEVWMKRKRKAG